MPEAPLSESVEGTPHPALAPLVERYTGYRLSGFPAGVHYGLPGGTLTFIVAVGAPLHVVEAPAGAAGCGAGRYDTLVGGLHARRALIGHDGAMEGVQVDLRPLAARSLLAVPAADLAHQVVALRDLLGRAADELHDRVSGAVGWPARFAAVDRVLLRSLAARPHATRRELDWAWSQLDRSGGRVAVGGLADEIGWSARHFRNVFTTEVGLTPKTAARVLRFDRARRLVQSPTRPSLADIAARCGFADQSHLAREFRAIVDRSPTQLLADDPTLASFLLEG